MLCVVCVVSGYKSEEKTVRQLEMTWVLIPPPRLGLGEASYPEPHPILQIPPSPSFDRPPSHAPLRPSAALSAPFSSHKHAQTYQKYVRMSGVAAPALEAHPARPASGPFHRVPGPARSCERSPPGGPGWPSSAGFHAGTRGGAVPELLSAGLTSRISLWSSSAL